MEQIRKDKIVNIPNLLTVLRIALLPTVVWRFVKGDRFGALGFYLLAMLTDAVDGILARRLNQVTALRIAFLPAVVWRFQAGDRFGALGFYLLAMLTDAADGILARRLNQITALGKLLDPLADKLSLLTLLWLFVAEKAIPLWVLFVELLREVALIIGGVVALRRGVVVYALPIGKVTTVGFVLSIVARFVGIVPVADALLYISVALSMIALAWYTVVTMRRIGLFPSEKKE